MSIREKFEELIHKETITGFDPDFYQTLYKYSLDCEHITEVGVRWVMSTFAFLYAKPKKLILIDIDHPNDHTSFNGPENFKLAKQFAKKLKVDMPFIQGNILDIELEETDLLFIDTEHSYLQLKSELRMHADKVRKYIIMHDTKSHAYVDSNSYGLRHTLKEIDAGDYQKAGLEPTIQEFLQANTHWELYERIETGQGITILKRV